MLLLGQQRQRTCRPHAAGLPASRRQHRARPVAGRPAALAGPGRCADVRVREVGPSALAVGRPGAARHLGPQAGRAPRIPRSLHTHRHAVPGVRIGELFPQMARLADPFSIIRSLHTGSNDHGVAGTIGLTGSAAGGVGLGGKRWPGGPPGRRPGRWWPRVARCQPAVAAVHGHRRPAAPGQEGHRRRGRRRARRPLRSIPSRI